jgi:hypothetical protein
VLIVLTFFIGDAKEPSNSDVWGLSRVVHHILDRAPLQSVADADERTCSILQLLRIIANVNECVAVLLDSRFQDIEMTTLVIVDCGEANPWPRE